MSWIGRRTISHSGCARVRGAILSVPYPLELNDIPSLVSRQHTAREFEEMIIDQFDEMLRRSERYPLVFSIAVHPFIIGQPFRMQAVRRALDHILKRRENSLDHDARRNRPLLRQIARRGSAASFERWCGVRRDLGCSKSKIVSAAANRRMSDIASLRVERLREASGAGQSRDVDARDVQESPQSVEDESPVDARPGGASPGALGATIASNLRASSSKAGLSAAA